MTDTDKLKRLAEEALKYDPTGWREAAFKEPEALAILALIAENERLKAERDEDAVLISNLEGWMSDAAEKRNEAVALLRDVAPHALCLSSVAGDDTASEDWERAKSFLARIDVKDSE